MATTEYVLFSKDFADGYDENGELAEWRCGICRRAASLVDDVWHYVTICEHMVRGYDTYDGDKGYDDDAVAVWRTEHRDGPTSWACEDVECGEVALCHDCWSNL